MPQQDGVRKTRDDVQTEGGKKVQGGFAFDGGFFFIFIILILFFFMMPCGFNAAK
ncbi:hypothetical protein [Desulfotomaculum copahuensis]|uniref:hypothetical protein n=1 Tax=Desulfotomaculum copahuensis TaxID=1838280 RepID=UPI000A9C212E|nr:hypothetical protein [Desulfotomaculum copahuensis]